MKTGMSVEVHTSTGSGNFGFTDIIVILICLSTAAASIYMFRCDLLRTIDSYDEEPAGVIIISTNIIQRRHADRVLWDRIFVDSPVYTGDLIRTADLSTVTVHIDANQICLEENTLIRIQDAPEKQGPFQIELQEGNLSFATGSEGSGLMLNLMGRQVQAVPGTVINAGIGEEGMVVQVNEGKAIFIEEGQSRNLDTGMMIAQDIKGVERKIPTTVVTSPRLNACYLKNSPEPLSVNFTWNCLNIEAGETLCLEIAGDRNFTKEYRIIEGLGSQTQAALGVGLWYWQLVYDNVILSAGQITVVDASGPELQSPAMNSVFRYQNDLPQLRFQWSEKPEASHYIIELAPAKADGITTDFNNPQIRRQSVATSLIQSNLGPGIWYWRVQPVFPSAYHDLAHDADYSAVGSFRIEQSNDPHAPALELPVAAIVNERDSADIQVIAGKNYTVQTGDTLGQIASQAYKLASNWKIIAEANDLSNPDLIFPCQVLYLPPVE